MEKQVDAEVVDSETTPPLPTEFVAKGTVTKYIYGSMALGLVPVPMADIALISALNLKMLHSLSKLYDIPFSKDLGKDIIASLLAGGAATNVGLIIRSSSMLKSIPLVGQIISMLGVPICAGAFTYAVGKVFIQHFEAGGTFLNFNPEKVKEYFAAEFEAGKIKVKKMKDQACGCEC